MKQLTIILLFLGVSGCTPIIVVEALPQNGKCEKLAVLEADGQNEKEIQSNLEKEAEKVGGNLLLFEAEQTYQITLSHPVNTLTKHINGVGTAYKCIY